MPIRKIFIVEDDALIAMLLEDMISELGYENAGIAGGVEAALVMAEKGGFDAAILDVSLGRQKSFPVADRLQEMGKPFAFATGHGAEDIDPRFSSHPTLQKPFQIAQLEAVLAGMTDH